MEDIKIINVPEGYMVDKENIIVNLKEGVINIKLKEKVKRWRDNANNLITGYFIGSCSSIGHFNSCYNTPENYNIFATEKQAKSALAMARISQIMANDERFGGVITDEEWKSNINKFVIERCDGINKSVYSHMHSFLAFHTEKQRDLFLKENEDLIKDYLMID